MFNVKKKNFIILKIIIIDIVGPQLIITILGTNNSKKSREIIKNPFFIQIAFF